MKYIVLLVFLLSFSNAVSAYKNYFAFDNDIFDAYYKREIIDISSEIADKRIISLCYSKVHNGAKMSLAFNFYKHLNQQMCCLIIVNDCNLTTFVNIILDSIKITMPTDEKIWFDGKDYYPFPNKPIIRYSEDIYAVIYYNKHFEKYFEFDIFDNNKSNKIYQQRKEYSEKMKSIADELWDAYINKKFKLGTYKDRSVLYIEKPAN